MRVGMRTEAPGTRNGFRIRGIRIRRSAFFTFSFENEVELHFPPHRLIEFHAGLRRIRVIRAIRGSDFDRRYGSRDIQSFEPRPGLLAFAAARLIAR